MKKIIFATLVVASSVTFAQTPGDWNTARDDAANFIQNKNTQMYQQERALNNVSDAAENFQGNGGFSQFRRDNSHGSIQRPDFGGNRPEFNRPEINVHPHPEFRR